MASAQVNPASDLHPESRAVTAGDAWRNSSGSARAMRYVSVLYTCFFFIEPYLQHSRSYWLWFAAFYAAFLALYFAIPYARGTTQRVLFVLLFALSYAYFPFNQSACGAFVFPVVMLAFVMRDTRLYLAILAVTAAGIALETGLLHLSWWAGLLGIFLCVVIGLSNLSYSRQQQAAYALQRANKEIEHLAQVAERERIARDLHDLLGHTLTLIAIKSELANRLIERDPQRAAQEMQEVEQTARKALAEVREVVVGYRSEGFASEVARARRTLLTAGVTLYDSIGAVDLTPAESNVLCLCLREAVTNIVRHANATTCDLRLTREPGCLRLIIEDNGRTTGDDGVIREGNGLRGMRERVRELKGNLNISVIPEVGTHLQIEIPSKKLRSTQPQKETITA